MKLYKKLFSYAKEKSVYGYAAVILSALATTFWVLPFWYLWKFLEGIFILKNTQKAGLYVTYIIFYLILYIVTYFIALMSSHLLAFRLESNLRKIAAQNLMEASFSFYDLNPSGKVRKLIDDNAAQTHTIVAHLIPDITGAFVLPILLLLLMFYVDIRLGIFLILVIILGGLPMAFLMGDSKFMERYMSSIERMNAKAVEYVRGMQVLKIFGTSVESFKGFYDAIVAYSTDTLNYSLSCRIPYVLFQVIFNIVIVLPIPFAYFFIRNDGDMYVILAKLIFFACLSGLVYSTLMKVMHVNMYHSQAQMVVEKLETLIEDMKSKSISFGNVSEMKSYNIEFDKVSFAYENELVLENLSFKLEGGKTYAIVGASGGGKSTIAKLISGFYPLNSGKILIGNVDLKDYTEESIMKNIAFVFQNTKLFKKSIYDNVRLANPNSTKEEVMQALHSACCDDILDKFPERENTVIGSTGVYLSGGETQRIAIARAILKNAKVIILDEAGAAADPENEYQIQQAFSNLMKGKTVIMIAHRLSSIVNVDEILVIYGGKIIERGNHKELIEKNGKYKYLQDSFNKANEWRVYE